MAGLNSQPADWPQLCIVNANELKGLSMHDLGTVSMDSPKGRWPGPCEFHLIEWDAVDKHGQLSDTEPLEFA